MQGLVTVFGGSGFLGAQVVRALAKSGLRVRVAARNPGRGYRLRMLGDVGQIEVVQANLTNAASVARALDGAEAVVNLVGLLFETGGRRSFQAVHVDSAAGLAQAAASRGISRFVQVSALGADPASPSRYGRTKAAGEAAVRAAIPTATVIRPSLLFGPEDGFFNRFASMAAIAPALPLVGGGKTRFQPLFVGDCAAAIARCVTDPATAGRTYELGGPGVYTLAELMRMILDVTGRNRLLLPVPFPVADAIGMVGQLLAGLVPPLLTADQAKMLRADAVASGPGLAELGVQPTTLEAVLPTYLYRYRKGGQFAEKMATG